jgi:hypothetical protein
MHNIPVTEIDKILESSKKIGFHKNYNSEIPDYFVQKNGNDPFK